MKLSAIAILLALLLTSSSNADFILSFSQSNASIAVGQSISVDLILTQTAVVGGVDITQNGLVAADIELVLDTSAASVTTITPGAGFTDSLFGSDPTIPLASIQSINASGVTASIGFPTSIVLGTYTFFGNNIGTTVATTLDTSFTEFVFAQDPSPIADIDSLIFGSESFTLNVTAVPEPSSIILLGASICFLVTKRFRRSRDVLV